MNEKKIIKFNLYMSCILLVLLLLMFVATTVAYFTGLAQSKTTLTAGNVEIDLSEAAVKMDALGNWVEDSEKSRVSGEELETYIPDYGKIYPGQTIFKDPMITNTGDTAEWIAAKVTLNDGTGNLTNIMGYEEYDGIDIEVLFSGGLLDETVHFGTWNGIPNVCHNDRYAMIQVPNSAEGEYTFYFLMLEPVETGDSVVLFDRISLPTEWNNSDMKELADLKIHIRAYGVQLYQMESCLDAMITAFPSHFDFN